MLFANSFDPYQARKKVEPDLGPNCLILSCSDTLTSWNIKNVHVTNLTFQRERESGRERERERERERGVLFSMFLDL